jgi:hypothetical protein
MLLIFCVIDRRIIQRFWRCMINALILGSHHNDPWTTL